MTALTILPAPDAEHPAEVSLWLRQVGIGAAQLLREATCELADDVLRSACAWLATDLGAICEATGAYLEGKPFELTEDQADEERFEEMQRLLEVGTEILGCSEERAFLARAIRRRLICEKRTTRRMWVVRA